MSSITYDSINITNIGINLTAKISLKYRGKIYLCYVFISDFDNMNIPIDVDLITFIINNHSVKYDVELNIMLFDIGPGDSDNYKSYILYEHATSYIPVDLLNKMDKMNKEINRINKLILSNDKKCSEIIDAININNITIYNDILTIESNGRTLELPWDEFNRIYPEYTNETLIVDNRTENFDVISYIKPKMLIIYNNAKKSLKGKNNIINQMVNNMGNYITNIKIIKLYGKFNKNIIEDLSMTNIDLFIHLYELKFKTKDIIFKLLRDINDEYNTYQSIIDDNIL